jgi:transposase
MLFPENIGLRLSIDEVALSKGELYTFITNKQGKGQKKTLVASVKGTKAADIIQALEKIPLSKRLEVEEITLDMAKNMEAAAKRCFPNARLVTDRFHVVRLVGDALQHVRIQHRWEAIEQENKAIKQAKDKKEKYRPQVYENGDTPKQLLARCRYVIAKKPNDWTEKQRERALILFREFPDLKAAYYHSLYFRKIYENTLPGPAENAFREWISKTQRMKMKEFYTAAGTVEHHLENILNFFKNRSTNANAESFNAKIKLFRANLRGVTDTKFFLFRLAKLFA